MGTHNGAIFILDFKGEIVKMFRPHSAMVNDLSIDSGSDFVASASMDGASRAGVMHLPTAADHCTVRVQARLRFMLWPLPSPMSLTCGDRCDVSRSNPTSANATLDSSCLVAWQGI